MAQMKLTPVFRCRGCGASVMVTHLSTLKPDPEGKLLKEFMHNTAKIALCETCRDRYNYLASRNRADEFNRMYAPEGQLISIRGE